MEVQNESQTFNIFKNMVFCCHRKFLTENEAMFSNVPSQTVRNWRLSAGGGVNKGGVLPPPRDPPSNFFNFGPMSSNFLWEIEKCLKFHNFSKIMISAHQAHKSTSSNMQWFSNFDQNWGDSSNNLSKSFYVEQMSSVFLSEVQKYLYFWKIKKLLISAHQAQISTLTK